MRNWILSVGVGVTVLTLELAQPGVCPCWWFRDLDNIHPHLGREVEGHSHDYLSHWSDTAPVSAPAAALAPLATLLGTMVASAIWRTLRNPVILLRGAPVEPLIPPPRLVASDSIFQAAA